MLDMRQTIIPKSDQLNADDLIGKELIIKIRDVKIINNPQQPVSIFYEGDNDKPYKPCKSMRRVLVHVWGADGKYYIGKSISLYRDDTVLFAGMAVGGIRISKMSHITESKELSLMMSKTKSGAVKKNVIIEPLILKNTPENILFAVEMKINNYFATLENIDDLQTPEYKEWENKVFQYSEQEKITDDVKGIFLNAIADLSNKKPLIDDEIPY